MNNKTLSLLPENFEAFSFSDSFFVFDRVEEANALGLREFQVDTQVCFDDYTRLEVRLYFRKSDQKERYHFVKFDALLRYSVDPGKDRTQTFYMNKGMDITFREAFNLLQGRAVNKDLIDLAGGKYNAWIQLNFQKKDQYHNYKISQYNSSYRYELEKVLEKYPIGELQDEDSKEQLIRSLQMGNTQLVTFVKVQKTEKMFIAANPAFKTINIYPQARK